MHVDLVPGAEGSPKNDSLFFTPWEVASEENGYIALEGERAYYSPVLNAHFILRKSIIDNFSSAAVYDSLTILRPDSQTYEIIPEGEVMIIIDNNGDPHRQKSVIFTDDLINLSKLFSLLHEYAHDLARDLTRARVILNCIGRIFSGEVDEYLSDNSTELSDNFLLPLDTIEKPFDGDDAIEIIEAETAANSKAVILLYQIFSFCGTNKAAINSIEGGLDQQLRYSNNTYKISLETIVGLSIKTAAEIRLINTLFK